MGFGAEIASKNEKRIGELLELLKPEMLLQERGIRSTVVMFGGARIPEPGKEAWAALNEEQKRNLESNSAYYARKLAVKRRKGKNSCLPGYWRRYESCCL